ncbi:MAG: hypothetical protein LBU34_15720 [Planctomycetaceae bacterium]|jgi:hypothetical protein|nr:hypothetical protein [Planctomycetaceae bacterium]
MCITGVGAKRNLRIGILQGRQPLAERLRRRQPTENLYLFNPLSNYYTRQTLFST